MEWNFLHTHTLGFVETLNKFHKQARRETDWKHRHRVQHKSSNRDELQTRQYLKAESELTKLPGKITHTRFDTQWMISQPLTERDKVLQIQNEFPWKCAKFSVFRFAFWPMKDHDIIQGQRLRCTKDYWYFYPQIFPDLFAIPLCLEMGRWHMRGFSESSSPSWADCMSSGTLRQYSITQRAFTPLMFVSHVVCEGKIYLAHTLEWHTWFWQYTFWNPENIENS